MIAFVATLFTPLRVVGRGTAYVFRLVRDGEDDLDGAYPDRRRPTGSDAATTASVAMSLTGLGGSMYPLPVKPPPSQATPSPQRSGVPRPSDR